jgi:hypothetical protein
VIHERKGFFLILAELLSDELGKSVTHHNSAKIKIIIYFHNDKVSILLAVFIISFLGYNLLTSSVLFLDLPEFEA